MKKIHFVLVLFLSIGCFVACDNATKPKIVEKSLVKDALLMGKADFSGQDTSYTEVNQDSEDSYCSKYRGRKCSVQGPYDAVPCKCYGFSCGGRDASVCLRCGHHATKHTR